MVYESRVGDVFTLGTSTWRIEDITHDRVLVTPGAGPARAAAVLEGRPAGPPGRAGPGRRRLRPRGRRPDPGQGAGPGRRGRARRVGRPTTCSPTSTSSARPPATSPTTAPSSSSGSATRSATGGSPSTRRSAGRCTPRGRCACRRGCASGSASTSRRCTATTGSCSGCPTSSSRATAAGSGPSCSSWCGSTPTRCTTSSPSEIGGSALFAARFRECASRALLLPRRRPDRRQPLWQQRQRAAQLLEVASQYASFPIVLETVRECVQDVFDVPGLTDADARRSTSREVTLVDVESRPALAVRPVADVRLRRPVPLRGRLPARREARRRPRRSTPPCWPSCSAAARGCRCATCSTRPR